MLEEGDCIYKDTARNNQTRPAEDILGDGGMNSVRLRVWVNPVGGTYGLEYNLELAKRFQDEGYKIYLDFHFSYVSSIYHYCVEVLNDVVARGLIRINNRRQQHGRRR
jgi:arabinogalactan endo-1,4-beta-galactosidase